MKKKLSNIVGVLIVFLTGLSAQAQFVAYDAATSAVTWDVSTIVDSVIQAAIVGILGSVTFIVLGMGFRKVKRFLGARQ